MFEDTINPNATPGAGRGTPINPDRGMESFIERTGGYRDARNNTPNGIVSAGEGVSRRETKTPAAPASPSRSKGSSSSNGGSEEFHVIKDGVLGTMMIQAGGFTEL